MDKRRIELEEKYKTQHLPDNVREMVFHVAYERGHAYGLAEVDIEYDDLAGLAKTAYSAGYDAARTVCELEAAPVVGADALMRALESVLRSSQTVDSYDGIRAACKRVGLTIDSHGDCTWTGAKP